MAIDGGRLKVEAAVVDGADVLTLTGEIDIATIKSLDSALAGLVSQDLVVDLRGVTFMDSTGVHSLLKARNRVQENGGEVRLILGNPGHIRRLLYAAGVLDHFTIEDGAESDQPGD